MGDLLHLFPRHRAHRADKYSHPSHRMHRDYFGGVRVDEYEPKHRKDSTRRIRNLDIF